MKLSATSQGIVISFLFLLVMGFSSGGSGYGSCAMPWYLVAYRSAMQLRMVSVASVLEAMG